MPYNIAINTFPRRPVTKTDKNLMDILRYHPNGTLPNGDLYDQTNSLLSNRLAKMKAFSNSICKTEPAILTCYVCFEVKNSAVDPASWFKLQS